MADRTDRAADSKATGYHGGSVDTVISVEEVNRQAAAMAEAGIDRARIAELAGDDPFVRIEGLRAGYGKMEILHDFELQVARRGARRRSETRWSRDGFARSRRPY